MHLGEVNLVTLFLSQQTTVKALEMQKNQGGNDHLNIQYMHEP